MDVMEFLCCINGGSAYMTVQARDEYEAQERAALEAYRISGLVAGKCEVYRKAAPAFHYRLSVGVERDPTADLPPLEEAMEDAFDMVGTREVLIEEPVAAA